MEDEKIEILDGDNPEMLEHRLEQERLLKNQNENKKIKVEKIIKTPQNNKIAKASSDCKETPSEKNLDEETEEEISDEEISIESIIRAENEEIEDEDEDEEIESDEELDLGTRVKNIIKAQNALDDFSDDEAKEILTESKNIRDIPKVIKKFAGGKGGKRKSVLDKVKEMNLEKRL